MLFRTACLFAALCSLSVSALPFTVQFTYSEVSGFGGSSADKFSFQLIEPTGTLKISQLSVTLGSGLIYDLTNASSGYLGWGNYAVNDGGAGSTLISPPIGEGTSGNRTAIWNLTNLSNGIQFGFQADIDESGLCAPGPGGNVCRLGVDGVTPIEFVLRGAVDVAIVMASGEQFVFPASGQLFTTTQQTAMAIYNGDTATPEPATVLFALAGLGLCILLRQRH